MSIKPFKIAPFSSGLVKDQEPWLIPEDAYQSLDDAYVWRGRVKKRFGYYNLGFSPLNGRLRINIGTTNGAGTLVATIVPGNVWAVGQMFSVGTQIYTVKTAGSNSMLATSGVGTFDTATGTVTITGSSAVSTDVYFYPSTPVMGLISRIINQVNFETLIGFDQQFSYKRQAGSWERLTTGAATWTGGNDDFFWSWNYQGIISSDSFLFVVNNVQADGIRYLNTADTWTKLSPVINTAGVILQTCLLIIGFKDRLIAFNTTENGLKYKNRARFSQNGKVTDPATDWKQDVKGKGGYIDAYTQEAIVTAELIKDRLIVYFERSTWELVYTGNQTLPFRWQLLNSELGAESTFSVVGFDKMAVAVGNVGIHACNAVNVERIDQKIPDEVFNIHNTNSGPQRVYGIRDYYKELVYWIFPSIENNPTFPNRILVWNYINNTWSFFNDSFTCFGYFQRDSLLTWALLGETYGTWAAWGGTWEGTQEQQEFKSIVAGNQQGFVFVINTDETFNSESLYITDIDNSGSVPQFTVINHNLKNGDYVKVEGLSALMPSSNTFRVSVVSANVIQPDVNSLPLFTLTGTYTGNGYLTRISNLNIISKQWNPLTDQGMQFLIPYIDFLINNTSNGEDIPSGGEISVDIFTDFNENASLEQFTIPNSISVGSNVISTYNENTIPNQENQTMIWHRYYIGTQGQTIQIKIYMSNDQMRDENISQQDFVLNGLVLYIQPRGRLIQ